MPVRVVVWVNVCLSLRSTGLVEAFHVPASYPVQSTERTEFNENHNNNKNKQNNVTRAVKYATFAIH